MNKPRTRALGIGGLIVTSLVVLGSLVYWRLVSPNGAAASIESSGRRPDFLYTEEVVPTTPPLQSSLALDQVAAGFTLPDLFDESQVYKLEDYAGRAVILNFWTSWCGPCMDEMPALQRAYASRKDEGLTVLGINGTHIDNLEDARTFVTELNLTFPVLRDDKGLVSDDKYRVIGLPTSVFITRSGKVSYIQIGVMTEEEVEAYSSQLLVGEYVGP